MDFYVRHQITLFEEEVYAFRLGDSIRYIGYWRSKRKSLAEPFGYDWYDFYREDKLAELELINKKYPEYQDEVIYDPYNPMIIERQEVHKKYNPVEQGLLGGSFGPNPSKGCPVKISKEKILEALIEEIKKKTIVLD